MPAHSDTRLRHAPPVTIPPVPPHRRWRDLIEGASALVRRRTLERRLAGGADPAAAPMLARRAAELAGARTRAAIAASLERILRDARHRRRHQLSSAVPVSRREVLLAEPYLLHMIARLRDGRPINPVAIARIRVMLADGCSALYSGENHGALREWARAVLIELDDGLA